MSINSLCSNAVAVFDDKNVKGSVKFHQCAYDSGTTVILNLYNLEPKQERAIHIHEYGDETDGCTSLGGHWNPMHKNHGSIFVDINESHAGDLTNNIKPDNEGKVKISYYDPRLQIRGDVNESIIGRSVVIHESIDDLGLGNNKESKITGNAGKRMACAIIGQVKPSRKIVANMT